MERKIDLKGSFSTDWIKYSDYEYKEEADGVLYIVPREGATFTLYNPFDKAEPLVMDTLQLGDAYKAYLTKKLDFEAVLKMLMVYVRKYGLLGLISSNVYNRDIIGEKEVILMAQNCLKTKERLMDAEKYMKHFTPFAEEMDLQLRHYKNSVDLVKAEDSPKYYGKRPQVIDLIFSKFYAEQVTWVLEFAAMLSEHYNQLQIYKQSGGTLTEPVTILAKDFQASKLGFTIQHLDKTEIAWEFDALKTAIQTMYAFAITSEDISLNRCEHCHSFYLALTDREKYCSPACRNRSNVQKSRARKNAKEAESQEE